jgi:hypothetical protein
VNARTQFNALFEFEEPDTDPDDLDTSKLDSLENE